MDKFNSNALVVMAEQEPGIVLFHNYETLKAELERGLTYYNSFEYSIENIDMAITNRDELKNVKKILEEKKKEIKSRLKDGAGVLTKRTMSREKTELMFGAYKSAGKVNQL